MRVHKTVTAGSLESSDALVTISPSAEEGLAYQIESIVIKQYGARIRRVTEEVATAAGISGASIHVQDRGALECTLRARLETAIARSSERG
ncbi:MAG: citrate lyase acyl carrier protein [Spirochaetes bacterium]|nr:citrate lyase acyl carrier protein [Spirochaetota bacterium]